jgi:hypothetical protein
MIPGQKKTLCRKKMITCCLAVILSQAVTGQRAADSIRRLFDRQRDIFPQEKIYLHTDRDCYDAGDTIWFRAYPVDAATHIPYVASCYVYVELIDPADSVILRVKIERSEANVFCGYLPVPPHAAAAQYVLRAYTRNMYNVGEAFFCMQSVRVSNPSMQRSRTAAMSQNSEDWDVSFYPEGGSMLPDVVGKVAFKAMKSNGMPLHVKGKVYGDDGAFCLDFETTVQGMGVFPFRPEKGKSYYAVCTNSAGVSRRFSLPAMTGQRIALTCNSIYDKLYVSVSGDVSEDCYLLAHSRGIVYHVEPWKPDGKAVAFTRSSFPSGILHLLLFDREMNPVSERLVFILNDDQAGLKVQTDRETHPARNRIAVNIELTDAAGRPLTGSCSVAVTEDRATPSDAGADIISSLLLASDIGENIGNPAFFLQNSRLSAFALDLLMMTNGWRRYDVKRLVRGEFQHPDILPEVRQEVKGTVRNLLTGRPAKDMPVTLFTSDGKYFGTVSTDNNGRFVFLNADMPDSTTVFLQTSPKSGLNRYELILEEEHFPPKTLPFHAGGAGGSSEVSAVSERYPEQAQIRHDAEDVARTINLDEITVTAPAPGPKTRKSPYYTQPNYSITEEELNAFPPGNVDRLLGSFPGVTISRLDGEFEIMVNNYGNYGQPALMVDGIFVEKDYIDAMNINDIAQVDLLKGVNASIFGMRGAGGIIAFFTKDGKSGRLQSPNPPPYARTVMPLGIQRPAEFYAPGYDTRQPKAGGKPDVRKTVYWQPVLRTGADGKAAFEFYTSDTDSSCTVVIEGISSSGKIIRQKKKIGRE